MAVRSWKILSPESSQKTGLTVKYNELRTLEMDQSCTTKLRNTGGILRKLGKHSGNLCFSLGLFTLPPLQLCGAEVL